MHHGKRKATRVARYDGQNIWVREDGGNNAAEPDFQLGSFLGGGAAGVVYEAECLKTKKHYAVKVLNPIGFKLAPANGVKICDVAVKGVPYSSGQRGTQAPPMGEEHVWWLVNPNTRQLIAAYYDSRTGQLREMTLPRCMEVWGVEPKALGLGGSGGGGSAPQAAILEDQVFVNGEIVNIPIVPPKYEKFLRTRRGLSLEIEHMQQLSEHKNILRLHEVLELVQDTKTTLFLVLELAQGGELFDRIKVDCGADEDVSRDYFRQLLSGVRHCHDRGVCHRDLKPENLLLADHEDSSTLKIADFGFSALFHCLSEADAGGNSGTSPRSIPGSSLPASLLSVSATGLAATGPQQQQLDSVDPAESGGSPGGIILGGSSPRIGGVSGRNVRRLRSVVGSPFYVAPEVLREAEGDQGGYDGTKADVWSSGIILYAMLAGNLPFEKDLHTCVRFDKFGVWARAFKIGAAVRSHCTRRNSKASTESKMARLDYPSWFFPRHFSVAAKSLVAGLLHPDPAERLSVREAQRHPWVRAASGRGSGGGGRGGGSGGGVSLSDTGVRGGSSSVNIDGGGGPGSSSGGSCCSGSSSDSDTSPCMPKDILPGHIVHAVAPLHRAAASSRGLGIEFGLGMGMGLGGSSGVSLVAGEPMGHIQESLVEEEGEDVMLPEGLRALSLDSENPASPVSSTSLLLPSAAPGLLQLQPLHLPPAVLAGSSSSSGAEPQGSPQVLPGDGGVIDGSSPALLRMRERGGVFNSPPLAPTVGGTMVGGPPGFSLEDGSNGSYNFDGYGNLGLRGTSWCGLVSLDTAGSDDAGLPSFPAAGSSSSGNRSSGNLNLSSGGFSGNLNAATVNSVGASSNASRPPAFNELVKRSTRFLTAVPATEVLRKLAEIVSSEPNKHQKAVVHWDEFRLEAMQSKRGGLMLWTAQIYLVRGRDGGGLYVVDFQRGQMDIFHFKRTYEDVRRRLSELVRQDNSLALLDSGKVGSHAFRSFPQA